MDESSVSSESVHLIWALSLIILSPVFIALEVLLVYVVCAYKDYRTNITYIIIVAIGITELIGNIGQVYTGLCILINVPILFHISKYIGAFTFSFFSVSICLYLILGLNRLDVFKPAWLNFSVTNKHINALFILTAVLCGVAVGTCLSPWLSLVFDRNHIIWVFRGPLTGAFMMVLFWSNTAMLVVTLLCYILIFWAIVARRRSKATGNKVESAEIKLLIGATIQFLAVLLTNAAFYLEAMIPYLFISMIVLVMNGIKSVVHLCVNTKLRRRCLKALHCSTAKVQNSFASSVGLPINQKNLVLINTRAPNAII